jgi:hypothetical protein
MFKGGPESILEGLNLLGALSIRGKIRGESIIHEGIEGEQPAQPTLDQELASKEKPDLPSSE